MTGDNSGIIATALFYREGGRWRMEITGQNWLIKDMLAELRQSGMAMKVVTSDDSSITFAQPYPLSLTD